ncbi:hypothetical protein YC2023_042975 [Brassica napus]
MLTNIFEYVLCLCFQDALIHMYDLQTRNWVSGYQAASDDLQFQMMTMKIKKDVQLKVANASRYRQFVTIMSLKRKKTPNIFYYLNTIEFLFFFFFFSSKRLLY